MKLLRLKDVIGATGLSRVTIWRLEKAGAFPARRRLGTNSVAWLEDEVNAWIGSRPVVSSGGAATQGGTAAAVQENQLSGK